ncbi:MAG: hypothetical protein HY207_05820 [Nitrospirae bacterium]|nr:hypothetical protein [Nitrospirota bacterium]
MPAQTLSAKGPSRELPLSAAIHDLLNTPKQYDGRRVLVSGFVRSIEFERGRLGSEYAILVLEETVSSVPPSVYAVRVISLTFPTVRKCQHALVQGTYHLEGNQAGRPYEHFIDAEAVLQDDAVDSGRVPSGCEKKL